MDYIKNILFHFLLLNVNRTTHPMTKRVPHPLFTVKPIKKRNKVVNIFMNKNKVNRITYIVLHPLYNTKNDLLHRLEQLGWPVIFQ